MLMTRQNELRTWRRSDIDSMPRDYIIDAEILARGA